MNIIIHAKKYLNILESVVLRPEIGYGLPRYSFSLRSIWTYTSHEKLLKRSLKFEEFPHSTLKTTLLRTLRSSTSIPWHIIYKRKSDKYKIRTFNCEVRRHRCGGRFCARWHSKTPFLLLCTFIDCLEWYLHIIYFILFYFQGWIIIILNEHEQWVLIQCVL